MIKAKDEEHGWNIGLEAVDYVPHDARQRVWGMKKGRLETMVEEGLNPRVVEGMSVLDGVNAARRTLPRVVFHERCEEQGIARSEERRVGKEGASKCRYRWSPEQLKKKKK